MTQAIRAAHNTDHNQLNELGEKIFLDRYALKDMTRATLAVGDTVVVLVDPKTNQREIGRVTAIARPQVEVELRDGASMTLPIEHVDKPIETDPVQMMARIARGVASVETSAEAQAAWEAKFRAILEGWKFVPAGRILTAAGTDQQLTYYNCYVVPSPHDSRSGIIKTLAQMTEIMSRGGGVGINLSSLRPRHNYVRGVNGRSSGSVSWGALYSFVTGLIEQGGCFGPDERILTDQGMIPARELADRIDAGEDFCAQTHKGWRRIMARFRNGVKPLFEVTTHRGFSVKVTEDHKMGVLTDGKITTKALKHLQEGDEILLLLGDGVDTPCYPLRPLTYQRSVMSTTLNTDVRLPQVLDEELAYLLGYMHADGYVHVGQKVTWSAPKAIRMATADAHPDIHARVVETARRVFGVEPVIESHGDSACKNVSIYSRLVIEWLSLNGLLKARAEDIRVPEGIFRSPTRVQAAFIAGYFDADGCNRGRKGGFGIDSISLDGLRDIQQLLATNGIVSAIHTTDRSKQGWRTIHRLSVTGARFKRRFVDLVDTAKRGGDTGSREMYNTYPATVWSAMNAPSKYRQRIYDGVSERISFGQLIDIRARMSADRQIEHVERLDDMLCVMPDSIASITALGESEVYDFEVDEVHLISGAGVYTSNSRRGALMLILNDWHPDMFDFINSKRTAGKITNANISVGVSDALLAAVKADGDWHLEFPDTRHTDYNAAWDGDLNAWKQSGRPVIQHKTVKAREVWNAIIESAWSSAEPGVFFIDRYNAMSNSAYFAPIIATNPCTTGDTLVATENGYTKARDLRIGMQIRTPAGLKPIAKVFNNGVQRIHRVDFSDGGYLECTADHKLKVVRGKKYEWVTVTDLRRGDKVLVSSNEAFGPTRRLPEEAISYVEKRALNVAEYYDRKLGFLAGVVLGDGTLRKVAARNSHSYQCKVAFGVRESDWTEHFRGVLDGMGIHTNLTHVKKDVPMPDGTLIAHEAIRVECYKLATLLVKIGMTPNVKAPDKTIPQAFMGLDREFLAGLLDGLFTTDGNVHMKADNPMLRFSTASHELAQQVRLLLLQFGVHGRIYAQRRDAALRYDGRSMVGTGVKYDVVIMNEGVARFYGQIGLTHPHKAARLKDVAENWHHIGGTWTASVQSVTDTGRDEEVFDVFEPDTLTWVTNGYVSFDCGEQGLPAWGVCNLGAVNLAKFYDAERNDVAWDDLGETVRHSVRFLDNIIDATPYFFDENRDQQLKERRVGLNTMGVAELMIRLGIRYGSDESVKWLDKLYEFIAVNSYEASIGLAKERGAFPAFDAAKHVQSGYIKSLPTRIRDDVKRHGVRNVTLLTQAPNGTIGTMVDTSTGIEPFYSWTYFRKSRLGLHEQNVAVVEEWKQAHPGQALPDFFVTAMDLAPEEHVRVQAAIQRWVDSSISKTCNVPNGYTVDQVRELYELMYDLGCKGGTIYRDGSRDEQVLMLKVDEAKADKAEAQAPAKPRPTVAPLPAHRNGVTVSKATPFGTIHVTSTHDEHGEPFEVFVTIGKAGSDLQADVEALGRLISLALRVDSPVPRLERLKLVISQLEGIGGARSFGMGPNRVLSLPDAVAATLRQIYLIGDSPGANGNGHGKPEGVQLSLPTIAPAAEPERVPANGHGHIAGADLCPQCGMGSLVRSEGCRKCLSCGYSEC